MPNGIRRFGIWAMLTALIFAAHGLSSEIPAPEPTEQQLLSGKPYIYRLSPEHPDGSGYKLIYIVDAPLNIYWKFKTDFDNDFLLSNKLITSHRFVSRHNNIIVTENIYAGKPRAVFRWQSTILSDQYHIKFTLQNPEECGQKYHYGYIQMQTFGRQTKVTQVAYFDFFGVSIWVRYPFYGGMSHFLNYTANWEQEIILKLKDQYSEK